MPLNCCYMYWLRVDRYGTLAVLWLCRFCCELSLRRLLDLIVTKTVPKVTFQYPSMLRGTVNRWKFCALDFSTRVENVALSRTACSSGTRTADHAVHRVTVTSFWTQLPPPCWRYNLLQQCNVVYMLANCFFCAFIHSLQVTLAQELADFCILLTICSR